MRPLIYAHRGASVAERENTIAAFAAAGALGADGVELDARRTLDGQIVVHHDDTLAGGDVIVEVARADLPAHVPSLAEALDACGGLIVNIEIKNWPGDRDFDPGEMVAAAVVDEVARRSMAKRVVVSSFHRPTIDRVRELDHELATAFLHVSTDGSPALAEAISHGHPLLHPWYGCVTQELVDAAHAAGVRVNTWTVDDPDQMRRLTELGVDGIVTNVPDVARAALGPREPLGARPED